MITDKKLYVMRSTIDPTLKKTLWAKDINDVHEKIGEYYQIISVTSPTPALRAMFDEYIIYVTPHSERFKHKVGDTLKYGFGKYTIIDRKVDKDCVWYELNNGKKLSQQWL
jgi:hypothetical protein